MKNLVRSKTMIACETSLGEFKCSKNWDELTSTTDASVRYCNNCGKTVHRAYTVQELNEMTAAGLCVAWCNTPEPEALPTPSVPLKWAC